MFEQQAVDPSDGLARQITREFDISDFNTDARCALDEVAQWNDTLSVEGVCFIANFSKALRIL
ncbi:hypothetical protein ACVWW4_003845 [Bradyrhizobium sp. LB7.1]